MNKLTLLPFLLFTSFTASAAGDHHGHNHGHHDHGHKPEMVKHDAHEHGVAEMNVAQVDNEIQIELETPAYNVLGFEHKPKNHEQEHLLDDVLEVLQKPADLFTISGMKCKVGHVDVDSPFGKVKHNHDKHDHGHKKESSESAHSDFEIEYHFECKADAKSVSIDASNLFIAFPNFSEIRVQWLSNKKQGSTVLNSNNKTINIK